LSLEGLEDGADAASNPDRSRSSNVATLRAGFRPRTAIARQFANQHWPAYSPPPWMPKNLRFSVLSDPASTEPVAGGDAASTRGQQA